MAFPFDYRQRQGFTQVMEELQQLEEDPMQLSIERTQRYNDPPPPYPSSGETTQPDSPTTDFDESVLSAQRNEAILQSMPHEQFHRQSCRERDRIIYQWQEERYGRKQTLQFDEALDFQANAENNVRARWVQQGIWKHEWGQAWPKGARAEDNRWLSSRENTGRPYPFGHWGHEKGRQPKLVKKPKTKIPNVFAGWGREEPGTTGKGGLTSRIDVAKEPTIEECGTTASRPYNQFLFQISLEREWLRDELQYKPDTAAPDIDTLAYENTKNFWIEDEVWNPTWGEQPGMTWMHEDLLDNLLSTALPHTVEEPHSHLPSAGAVNPTPTPGVHTDDASGKGYSSVSKEVGKRKRMAGTTQLPAIGESQRQAKEPAGRVLHKLRSSKVTKPKKSTSFSTCLHPVAKPPRRSDRIAKLQQKSSIERTAAQLRESPAQGKRKMAASSIRNSNESTTDDRLRRGKRECSSKGRKRARLQPRSK
ncbi:hypothetical protein BDV96DRAFT_578258 [Lophiotrema nucula]|uniref:Uncharacterized protein n=1 Tax=Lophiotrema nucula TaxID=690887 RepID=A0A6A5Z3Z2_9PLEO|nr:hypothetical protein BDV96DRAFT_578258 [Lophiotrema nucula]